MQACMTSSDLANILIANERMLQSMPFISIHHYNETTNTIVLGNRMELTLTCFHFISAEFHEWRHVKTIRDSRFGS